MDNPICSIVILSYNQLDYTKQCLESIKKYTTDVHYEIIIVDNASDKKTTDYLETKDDIILIKNNENLGFAGGCNQGIEASSGKYIMLLNNDTIVTKRWLSNMIHFLEENEEVSMTGPLTNATVGKQMIETSYKDDLEKMQIFAEKISNSDASPWRTLRLVAFCLLLRKNIFNEIGLFDTRFKVGNYEDDDFNIRALCARKKAFVCRNSFIHHFMNVSFMQKDICRERIMFKNKQILEEKWKGMNWNHHSVCNTYIYEKIVNQVGREVLHIGCGLGTLAVELKDYDKRFHVIGVENHIIRKKIASEFMDKVYFADDKMEYIENINKQFDIIVIECMLEKTGIVLLDKIKTLSRSDTLIILRVFNNRHITSIEKLITGKVEGDLLCSMSDEFIYHFDYSIENDIKKLGYEIKEKRDIMKSFSNLQINIYKKLEELMNDKIEIGVYNMIYQLELKNRIG